MSGLVRLVMAHTASTHGDVRPDGARVRFDFAVNVNPYAPLPRVAAAAREADIRAYPNAAPLAEALQARFGSAEQRVVVGAGATELIWRVTARYGSRGVLCVEPTFSEAKAAARAHGHPTAYLRAREAEGFALDFAALEQTLRRSPPGLVYTCQPANPTGRYEAPERWIALMRGFPATLFVLDESFLSLSVHWPDARRAQPTNCVRIRSLTKDLGLAGLRLGYALAAPSTAHELSVLAQPWALCTPAIDAGLAALSDWHLVEEQARLFLEDSLALQDELREAGFRVLSSATCFCLLRVENAAQTTSRLLEQGVWVRDATSFGLPAHLRLAGLGEAARRALLGALLESGAGRTW